MLNIMNDKFFIKLFHAEYLYGHDFKLKLRVSRS